MAVRWVALVAWVLGVLAAAGCVATTAEPEPTTPAKVEAEPPADTEMVRALEDLAAKPVVRVEAKHGKPALGEPRSPEKMCSHGACPTGYRCGYMPGHPRKVCYAAEAHRAGKPLSP